MRTSAGLRGFTLVELMVAIVVGGILLAAAYEFLVSQNRVYEVQGQSIDMQQNVRAALDFMNRELRNAGYGVAVDFGPDIFALTVNNDTADANIDNGTDSITFVANPYHGSVVASDASAGNTTLSVFPAPGRTLDFQATDVVDILSLEKKRLQNGLTISAVAYTDATQPTWLTCGALTSNVVAGSIVTVQPITITYRVKNRVLERGQNGVFQALIDNVEDLQLVYAFDDDGDGAIDTDADGVIWGVDADHNGSLETQVKNDGTTAALGAPVGIGGSSVGCDLRAIRVSLVVRTVRENPDPRFRSQYSRPRVEDHAAATTSDGFRRQVLQTVVKLRNMGI